MRSVAPMKAMIPHQGDATIRRLRVDDMFIASLEFFGSHHFLWTHLSRLISGLSDRIHGAPFCLFHESGGRNQRIECCIRYALSRETMRSEPGCFPVLLC